MSPVLDWLHDTMEPKTRTTAAHRFRLAYHCAVAGGLGAMILGTSEEIAAAWGPVLDAGFLCAALFFAGEYALRVASSSSAPSFEDEPAWHVRWRTMTSFPALIDLAAVLPVPLALALGATPKRAALFSILWAFKLFRYAPGAHMLGRVFRYAWEPLLSVFVAFIVVLLTAGTLIHVIEGEGHPDSFGSIPASLWWTVVTLTTTGYGDVTPVTPLGRMLAGGVMICGIAVFALWAGILANAFASEVRRREFLRTWDMITRVPMFHDLGAEAIADISRVLRPRDVSDGGTVFRRGDRGDCMYFIVSGAVEVRIPNDPRVLGPGEFFGEIALITGALRSATTVAMKPTLLLVLDIADFREIAARRPELSTVVREEAQRRMDDAR